MSSSTTSNRRVFREYIGAQFNGVQFDNVPIDPRVEFHFILAFALDYTKDPAEPVKTNGNFSEFWDTGNLTPQAVDAVKKKNPNVRVMLSVGGATVGGLDKEASFWPVDEASWVDNAVRTLTGLVDDYHLDGVDINYESFVVNSSMFASCIGNLLRMLKASKPGLITSIAPYSSTQGYYQALWNDYMDAIDYVNFQFYANRTDTTQEEYIGYYDVQAGNYQGGRVLAAINTSHPDAVTIVPPNVALNACQALNLAGKLKGIFIWSADSSRANHLIIPNYFYETAAQEMLGN